MDDAARATLATLELRIMREMTRMLLVDGAQSRADGREWLRDIKEAALRGATDAHRNNTETLDQELIAEELHGIIADFFVQTEALLDPET